MQFEPMNSESTHMEVCPMCGYRKPAQNTFKPNVMSEYLLAPSGKTKVVMNENEPQIDNDKGTWIRADLWNQYLASVTPATPPTGQQQQQQQKPPTPPAPAVQNPPTGILPQRDIPAGMMKTPAEVAASPKPTIAPVDSPAPVMSDTAAPAGLAKPTGPIGQPAAPSQP